MEGERKRERKREREREREKERERETERQIQNLVPTKCCCLLCSIDGEEDSASRGSRERRD